MPKKHCLIATVGLWALLMLTACGPGLQTGPVQTPVSVDAQIEELLKLGDQRLQQAQYLQAGDAFRAGLRLGPWGEQDARLLMGLAKSQSGAGQKAEALQSLRNLLIKHPDSPLAVEAHLFSAALEAELKQCPEAQTRLRALLAGKVRPLSADERTRAMSLLASCMADAGQPGAALQGVREMLTMSGQPMTPELRARLVDLAGRVPSAELEPLLAALQQPDWRAAMNLGLARSYWREGRLDQAASTLAMLRSQATAAPLETMIADLDREIEQARLVNPRAVGVILPLSGPYAQHGRRVLAAIELGLGLFGRTGSQPPTIYIEDSKGDPRATAEAVDRLVKQRRVIAILGPMGAATSLAAARLAQQENVPLIALSQIQGLTSAGEFIFQNFFTPTEQVDALLKEFMDKRGLRSFAVLAPRNNYGSGFVRLFSAGVAARGGSVVRMVTYDPKQTDYSRQVKELVKLPPGNYRPGMPDSPKPVIDFQALFIPDGPERTGMVTPNLAYFDVNYVWLLGTNLWHNDQLWKMAGRYMQWAVFPDAFDQSSQDHLVAGFITDYEEAMGHKPNVLDAHGFDSALLLRHLMDRSEPPRTRDGLRQALSQITGLNGVCGHLSVDNERRVRKNLTLFIHRGGQFKTLDDLQMIKPAAQDQDQPSGGGGQGSSASPSPGSHPEPGSPAVSAPASTIAR